MCRTRRAWPPIHAKACAAILALLLASACTHRKQQSNKPGELEPARYTLWVLGSAQDGGLPHVGCLRPCCSEARRNGTRQYPVSLGIADQRRKQLALIEASPAIEAQLALLQQRSGFHGSGRNPIDTLLLTHAHIGHYTGLMHFGREVAATRDLPVWTSPRMARFLTDNGPWSQLVKLGQIKLRVIPQTQTFEILGGLRIEAFTVPHRDEFSDTLAFKIHGPRRCVLFVPDIDAWSAHAGLLDRLLAGVDVAYLDGTFWDGRELPGRNLAEIPHPLMVDTMKRLATRARQQPGTIRFLHLNHSNPLWRNEALRARVRAAGFALAQRGERLEL